MIGSIRIDLERWVCVDGLHQLRIVVMNNGKEHRLQRDMKIDDLTTSFDYIFDTMKETLRRAIEEDLND